ncbi:TPA: hypothetical protein ACH3X1_001299 [Trebouxia sp. C0004]
MNGRPPRQSMSERIAQLNLKDVGSTKGQRKPRSTSEEGQGGISPFAGGKAFPANMDTDTMTLAAGTVTAMLAANGVGGDAKSSETALQKALDWLAEQPEDAAELAALLSEAAPKLGFNAQKSKIPGISRAATSRKSLELLHADMSLMQRLQAARPMLVGPGDINWHSLITVFSSEMLKFEEEQRILEEAANAALEEAAKALERPHTPPSRRGSGNLEQLSSPRGDLVEINTNLVLFCFFKPAQDFPSQERCLILKFLHTRLLTQSEQFANELTRHLDICAPNCRILRQKGSTASEWKECHAVALLIGKRGAEMADQMQRSACMLVMEYVPGSALFAVHGPFQAEKLEQTAADLGRLFLLDMLLGNADRFPCEALGWRGNPHNIMYSNYGPLQGRLVAIDATVQRRPPGGLVSAEDAACNRLTELALNDVEVAKAVLKEAVSGSRFAVEAVEQSDVAHITFQKAMRAGLQGTMRVKGLLEMMFEVLSDWIDAFIEDIEEVEASETGSTTPKGSLSPRDGRGPPHRRSSTSPSTTQKIRSINREAQRNDMIKQRLDHWKADMREKGEELRAAVEEWQTKRAVPEPRLTTGFLDGIQPIVDSYELKVRLEHMLQRLRSLQDAAATSRPTQLLPHLYVSGAVEASSLHVLRHLGITHILNATEDLLQPDEAQGFVCRRYPLKDVEEQEIIPFFSQATDFIHEAQQSGGKLLLHCHEGKSRSITLALAYLMQTKDWTLKEALEFVTQHRPCASPNAGFMTQLLKLEQKLHGKKTVKVKRTKPDPRVCSICHEVVGVSAASLSVHVKKQHPDHT